MSLLHGREGVQFASPIISEGVIRHTTRGFSVRLLSKMNAEAQRYRRSQVSDAIGGIENGLDEDLDSLATARRSTEASRVVTRSFHRAFDEELERLASTKLGLGPTMSFVRNLSFGRTRGSDPKGGDAGGPASTTSAARPADALRADLGVRLDAHPALFVRTRFRGLNGRIDLPVLDERIRLSLDSALGSRGRVALSSGMPRDGQGWATLIFNFSF